MQQRRLILHFCILQQTLRFQRQNGIRFWSCCNYWLIDEAAGFSATNRICIIALIWFCLWDVEPPCNVLYAKLLPLQANQTFHNVDFKIISTNSFTWYQTILGLVLNFNYLSAVALTLPSRLNAICGVLQISWLYILLLVRSVCDNIEQSKFCSISPPSSCKPTHLGNLLLLLKLALLQHHDSLEFAINLRQ